MAFPQLLIQPLQAAPDGGFIPVQVGGKGQLGGGFQCQGIGYQGAGIQGQAGFRLGQGNILTAGQHQVMALGGKGILNGLGSFLLAHAPQRQTGDADPLGDFLAGRQEKIASCCQQKNQRQKKGKQPPLGAAGVIYRRCLGWGRVGAEGVNGINELLQILGGVGAVVPGRAIWLPGRRKFTFCDGCRLLL